MQESLVLCALSFKLIDNHMLSQCCSNSYAILVRLVIMHFIEATVTTFSAVTWNI